MLLVNIGGSINEENLWSGTCYSIGRELKKHYDIEECVISTKTGFRDKLYIGTRRYLLQEKCFWLFTKRYAKRASRELQEYIDNGKYDVVFSVGVACLNYLKTDTPVVYFSDAVFSSMVDYYWFGLKRREITEYNNTQRKTLENADLCIFSSHWAQKEAMLNYNISKKKTAVCLFGPNIEKDGLQQTEHSDFNLLFVGVDMKRKGIDVALECVEICNEMDPEHHYVLHVVGGDISKSINKQNVKVYGFLDKKKEKDSEQLEKLWSAADVFLLPTRAECSSIALCEAALYGIPSIAYNTGGLSDYIHDSKTGYLLNFEEGASAFAEKVVYLAKHEDVLRRMQKQARERYEKELNWDLMGKSIYQEIEKITVPKGNMLTEQ